MKSRQLQIALAPRIADVVRWKQAPKVLCIDIPIGLLHEAVPGGRECDREARKLLGRPRGSSVFPPPARRALKARTWEEADRLNRSTGPDAPGRPLQTFAIIPKIREIDELITRSLPIGIVEVHPEMCFFEMNGKRPVVESKKTAEGRRRRIRLLGNAWERKVSHIVESRPTGVGRDDIIDAMAACWTAERVLEGIAIPIPDKPSRDRRGLLMRIVR
jgi:predicted RNase H-like nuclease